MAGLTVKHNGPQFAEELLPFNFGVTVKDKAQVVYHCLHSACSRYVFCTKEQLNRGDFPTRVLISIDLKNMFNKMSRRRCHKILRRCFPHLLPVFDCLYKQANKIWYIRANGTKECILQVEGFAQGCPLSLFFAALVLGDLLQKLSDRFKTRAASRREAEIYVKTNNGVRGLCNPVAYVDDGYIVPVFEDVEWAMSLIKEHGPEIGAEFNVLKTTMLTGITGESVNERLPDPDHRKSFNRVLDKFCKKGKNTTGIKALGFPLGSAAFV